MLVRQIYIYMCTEKLYKYLYIQKNRILHCKRSERKGNSLAFNILITANNIKCF